MTGGKVTVSSPMIVIDRDSPGSRDEEERGSNVIVCPSVVKVLGPVTAGKVTVSSPITVID